jgi:hypothetical protein
MRQATSSHDLHCDVDTFWRLMLDEEYVKKLYLTDLQFKELEVLELTDACRRLRGVPKLNMPGPVIKLLGDRFSYEEQGTFDRDKGEWHWKLVPSVLASKLRIEGVIRCKAISPGECQRLDEATIEAKVFGLGKLLESSTEKEVLRTFATEAAFMNRWLVEHP